MKKLISCIVLALSILVVGCKKEDTNNTTTGNTSQFPVFSGYTATDMNAVPMGSADTTDWTHDNSWLTSEKNLFPQLQNMTSNFEPYASIYMFPAFPNPISATTNFLLSKESDVRFSFRVVNKNFNVLLSQDSMYSSTFALNTAGLTSSTDTMVRIYYLFERNDSCLFKGHGDLKIN